MKPHQIVVWDGTPATSRYLNADEESTMRPTPTTPSLRHIGQMTPAEKARLYLAATAPGAQLQEVAAAHGVPYASLKSFKNRQQRAKRRVMPCHV